MALDHERRVSQYPRPSAARRRCEFCGCTEDRPCQIFIAEGENGPHILPDGVALVGNERVTMEPCAWLLDDCCNAPACVNQAYAALGWITDELRMRAA